MSKMQRWPKIKVRWQDPVLWYLQILDKSRYCKTRFNNDLRIKSLHEEYIDFLISFSFISCHVSSNLYTDSKETYLKPGLIPGFRLLIWICVNVENLKCLQMALFRLFWHPEHTVGSLWDSKKRIMLNLKTFAWKVKEEILNLDQWWCYCLQHAIFVLITRNTGLLGH